MAGQLPHLGLIEIANWIYGAGHVAVERAIAQEQLGLVARPQRQAIECDRLVVEDDHARPRQHVAAPLHVHIGKLGKIGNPPAA